ncbi:MAG: nitrile hydratase subunit beta [Proteobacteria bacterium]|nr:nitrile hydratase subunit beta [Pseudomonadota bacterium]
MAKSAPKRKPHDIGGDPAGPVDTHEHTPTMTERRIDAMMQLLRQKPRAFWVTDENRRTIESLSPSTYRDSSYYEKWCYAMKSLLIEKGVLTDAEIEAKVADVRARLGAKSKPKKAGNKKP